MAIKINGLQTDSNAGPNNKTTELPPVSQTNMPETEALQLSQTAIALQSIKENMTQESEIDRNKINAYREAIAKGTHIINTHSIARKLLKLDGLF